MNQIGDKMENVTLTADATATETVKIEAKESGIDGNKL